MESEKDTWNTGHYNSSTFTSANYYRGKITKVILPGFQTVKYKIIPTIQKLDEPGVWYSNESSIWASSIQMRLL